MKDNENRMDHLQACNCFMMSSLGEHKAAVCVGVESLDEGEKPTFRTDRVPYKAMTNS